MSKFHDRILKHSVWQALTTLGPALDQAVRREGLDTQTVEDLDRLRVVLTFTGKRLAGADPFLVHAPLLDAIGSAVGSVQSEIESFVTTLDVAHIANANSHADSALTQLASVIVPLTPDDTGTLKDAAVAYREIIESQLSGLQGRFSQVIQDADATKLILDTLRAELAAERTHISTVLSDCQTQFSAAQDTRNTEYTAAQLIRQETFQTLFNEFNQKLTTQDAIFSGQRESAVSQYKHEFAELSEAHEESAMTFTPFPDPRGMLDFLESGILPRRVWDHGQEAFYRGADCVCSTAA